MHHLYYVFYNKEQTFNLFTSPLMVCLIMTTPIVFIVPNATLTQKVAFASVT